MNERTPGFFRKLATQQKPEMLWIGCSDSRVPANQIVDLLPGELFVHRNIGNVVAIGDVNCTAVIQFAVQTLGVKHIIVCGHYHCGGVQAALTGGQSGNVGEWISHIESVRQKHDKFLSELSGEIDRTSILCELNVIEQVQHVCSLDCVRTAWSEGRSLGVHGWVYDVGDGFLKDLETCVTAEDEV
ncbi:MAG: carbonic anhydrase, partial [Bdellovibrionales bacterium]|nr:carbonic anhydrase [Bdellovibrionales bacterium]